MVVFGMQRFRILYFRESVLDHAEEFRGRDILDAIERATSKPPHFRAEVWSDEKRVGEVGVAPALVAAHASVRTATQR